MSVHWQTKQGLLGLRPGSPLDNGPQEGDCSAWVAWEKGKVETKKTCQGALLSFSCRLPRQSSPPPLAHYLQDALASGPLDPPVVESAAGIKSKSLGKILVLKICCFVKNMVFVMILRSF